MEKPIAIAISDDRYVPMAHIKMIRAYTCEYYKEKQFCIGIWLDPENDEPLYEERFDTAKGLDSAMLSIMGNFEIVG